MGGEGGPEGASRAGRSGGAGQLWREVAEQLAAKHGHTVLNI
jgi:hypothetical protein